MESLEGQRLTAGQPFGFDCHPRLACFNRCCRNVHLLLYPHDLLRLRRRLGLSAAQFLERHTDAVLRPGTHFPAVLLRMAADGEGSCPFAGEGGCAVYAERPDVCRLFPLQQAALCDPGGTPIEMRYLLRPPPFCLGPREVRQRTPEDYCRGQQAGSFHPLTRRWAELARRFQQDPWGGEGPGCPRARMVFMALYNLDEFRRFVFESSFLKRYRLGPGVAARARAEEEELLGLAMDWVELLLWRRSSRRIAPR
jgi:hypothetical protein